MNSLRFAGLVFLSVFFLFHPAGAQYSEVRVGDIRVQALSKTLIRLEQKGPNGFEDRQTFTVVNRRWPGTAITIQKKADWTILTTSLWQIEIPNNARSIDSILIRMKNGDARYRFHGIPAARFFPEPVDTNQFWFLADAPRLIPPEWGAIPPPEKMTQHPSSGWDTTNNAEDVYVFLLERGKYETFRREFLNLTGPTPLPPLFTFGLWDSRYYTYTEESALQTIDLYRKKQIPLDMFVVDTDWRLGASHGYAVHEKLFPDMKRFIHRAHEKHVRLMYNDHPEAQTGSALNPAELQYRWDGLTSLLELGIDVWWYDRNWMTGLLEPMPGISKEVWGMRLYHDITKKFHPDRRPLIMSNVDGIDNGYWNTPSHPASHRFPIWWTGDQKSRWEYLEMGIANGVNSGIARFMPYVNEDLGGHTGGNPEPDQYVRWVQFGCFSPITRLHCTQGLTRYPWEFGEEAERIATEYIRLRYRLLPTLYAAARRAYEDGTPLLRRCDLEWPSEPEAKRDKQYFFGEDLLVAPYAVTKTRDVPLSTNFFQTSGGKPGLTGEYYDNQTLTGKPVFTRIDSVLNFILGTGSPDPRISPDHFSIRWTGFIHLPENSNRLKLKVIADDGVRVWIDDSLIVNAWHDQAATDYPLGWEFKPGRSYAIKIEFFENAGGAHFQAIQTSDVEQVFHAWIPPGNWQDAWTGKILHGPKLETLNPALWKCPVYIREGGIIFSVPQMQYTTEHPWDTVIIDAFVPSGQKIQSTRVLYEDDGVTPEYQKGVYRKTAVHLSRNGKKVQLFIDKANGTFTDAISQRDWVLRLNLPANTIPKNIQLNGKKIKSTNAVHLRIISDAEQKDDTILFPGVGGKPRPAAGTILEMTIQKVRVNHPVRISFDTAEE